MKRIFSVLVLLPLLSACTVNMTDSPTRTSTSSSTMRYRVCITNKTPNSVVLYNATTDSVNASWKNRTVAPGATTEIWWPSSSKNPWNYFRMDRDATSGEQWKSYKLTATRLSSSCATAPDSYVIESRAGVRSLYRR